MKVVGWIILFFGTLSGMGVLLIGGNLGGPILLIVIGLYLIHCAERKSKERKEKENWNGK